MPHNNSNSTIAHRSNRTNARLAAAAAASVRGMATATNHNTGGTQNNTGGVHGETAGTTAGLAEDQIAIVYALRREGGEELAFTDSRLEFYEEAYNSERQLKKLMLARWSSITMSNEYWDECRLLLSSSASNR